MTGHEAEAKRNVLEAQNTHGGWEVSLVYSNMAQAHATLYLAEQQRVANLLAAAKLILDNKDKPTDGGLRGWATDSEAVIHSRMADSDFWATLLGKEAADREGL